MSPSRARARTKFGNVRRFGRAREGEGVTPRRASRVCVRARATTARGDGGQTVTCAPRDGLAVTMASLSTLALERVELLDDESEDDFKYDGVSDPDADSDGGDDDDLDKVVRASRSKPAKVCRACVLLQQCVLCVCVCVCVCVCACVCLCVLGVGVWYGRLSHL